MNREIRFRAWDEINNQMIYPKIINESFSSLTSGDILNRCENLMQYTGLKDRNGKEIFEGDVVNWFNGHQSENMIVCFANGSFEFKRFQVKNNYYWLNVDTESISVVGNIFDNPELAK